MIYLRVLVGIVAVGYIALLAIAIVIGGAFEGFRSANISGSGPLWAALLPAAALCILMLVTAISPGNVTLLHITTGVCALALMSGFANKASVGVALLPLAAVWGLYYALLLKQLP